MRNLARLLTDAWSLAKPYWRSAERSRALLLLITVVGLNLALVGVTLLLTYWQRAFYNALEAKDWNSFVALLLWWRYTPADGFVPSFALLSIVFVILTVYAGYLRQALQIRWRQWMTHRYLGRWFADRAYYRLSVAEQGVDNPDQRIADDVRLFVDNSLSLAIGLLRSAASFAAFVILLWSLSEPVIFMDIAVPGYLVWSALTYAALGTWLSHRFGQRLIKLNFAQQNVEADFRFGLMRIRENAEGIAFYHGEQEELRGLSQRFAAIAENWRDIIKVTKNLSFFTSAFGQVALVFPFVVVAPAYFAERMSLGGIFQTSNAFVQVQSSLSWIVENYSALTGWCATVDRLASLDRTMATALDAGPALVADRGSDLSLTSFIVTLPDGRKLVEVGDLRVRSGERVLLTGPSGSGKSTLFRALVGIWQFGSGRVDRPSGRLLFIPQRAYLPEGSLKRAICYPGDATQFSDEQVIAALHDTGLGYLASQIDVTDRWDRKLSGGEQQRLMFTRAVVQRPDWLFLDEATSSLDLAAEQSLYQLLKTKLAGSSWISIAHHASLLEFHHRVLRVENRSVSVELADGQPS